MHKSLVYFSYVAILNLHTRLSVRILNQFNSKLVHAITNVQPNVLAGQLFSRGLISPEVKSDILTIEPATAREKASMLLSAIETSVATEGGHVLVEFCRVLQQHPELEILANTILQNAGTIQTLYVLYILGKTPGESPMYI